MIVTNRNPLTSAAKIQEVADEVVRRPIPSLSLDDFDQTELLNYLEPMHEIAANVGFGVGTYTHGVSVSTYGYAGGVLSPTQNRIYMIPAEEGEQANWHYIDCETGEVVAYANSLAPAAQNYAYQGGAYSPTQNRIYMAPYYQATQTTWHYIDCNTGVIEEYAVVVAPAEAIGGYQGAIYSPTQNRIYFIPAGASNEANWHYIDCDTGLVVRYPNLISPALGNNAYDGGCYSPTQNRIYMTPVNQAAEAVWHYIDCDTGDVVEYASNLVNLAVSNAYHGCVYSPTQNRIYFSPTAQATETHWHYIDCDTGDVIAYAPGVSNIVAYAYSGGTYSPIQNKIYFTPSSQGPETYWHYIDCSTGDVVEYVNGVTVVGTYSGGIYSPTKNRIYIIPSEQSSETVWHYIQEYSDIPVSRNLMASTLFNH